MMFNNPAKISLLPLAQMYGLMLSMYCSCVGSEDECIKVAERKSAISAGSPMSVLIVTRILHVDLSVEYVTRQRGTREGLARNVLKSEV